MFDGCHRIDLFQAHFFAQPILTDQVGVFHSFLGRSTMGVSGGDIQGFDSAGKRCQFAFFIETVDAGMRWAYRWAAALVASCFIGYTL